MKSIIKKPDDVQSVNPEPHLNGDGKKPRLTANRKPPLKAIQSLNKAVNAVNSLGFSIRKNELENRTEVDGVPLGDSAADSEIYLMVKGLGVVRRDAEDAMNVIADRNKFHPIRDYLTDCKNRWDRVNHVATLLDYITFSDPTGSDNKAMIVAQEKFFCRFLLGCAVRGMCQPGIFKHQTPMLVFSGSQGLGKSTLVKWLASGVGAEKYHIESAVNPDSKEAKRQAVTKWLWEVSELGSTTRRSDRESLKGFLTTGTHNYKVPYAAYHIDKPTLANFIGTINKESGFIDDPTGARRFLPVDLAGISHAYSDAIPDIDMLWGCVMHMLDTQSPELTKDEQKALRIMHEEHTVDNPLSTAMQEYFSIDPENTDSKMFTHQIIDYLRIHNVPISNNLKIAGREISDVLIPLGLESKKISINNSKGKGYRGISKLV